MSGRRSIDIDDILSNPRYSFEFRTLETPEERRARIRRDDDEAVHRRRIFWAIFTVLLVVGTAAFAVMLFSGNADNREWARNIVAAIGSGLAGYVGGSAIKKGSEHRPHVNPCSTAKRVAAVRVLTPSLV